MFDSSWELVNETCKECAGLMYESRQKVYDALKDDPLLEAYILDRLVDIAASAIVRVKAIESEVKE